MSEDPPSVLSEQAPASVPPEESVREETPLDPDYAERLTSLGAEWARVLETDASLVHFGSRYSVQHEGKPDQEVVPFFYDILDRRHEHYRRYIILALDQQGHPVADRYTTIHYMDLPSGKFASAEGMIATGIRGAGLTAPIEMAHMDILQREANRLGELGYTHGLQFHISNANLEMLQDLQAQYEQSKDPALLPKIDKLQTEQARWQRIYGPEGWLGFTDSWEKTFSADAAGEHPESSREVVMQRVEGQPRVITTTPLLPADAEQYRQGQVAQLRSIIAYIKGLSQETGHA